VSVPGVVLVALTLLLAAAPGARGQAAGGDTVQVDSTRARVLEALERISRPPVSRQLLVDGDSAFLAGVAARREAGRTQGSAAQAAGPDSVLALLLALPGFEPARYEGARAEFETAEGRLTLLSRAGVEARQAAGQVTDSLFAADSLGVPLPDSAAVLATDSVPAPIPDSLVAPALPEPPVAPRIRGTAEEGGGEGAPARLIFEGREIQADTAIRYFERSGRINTVGNTVTRDAGGDPLESRTLIYSLEEGRGTALGARTRYSEGTGEWFVYGDANSVAPGEAWLHDAIFTSCDLTEPHSHFKVDEIKIINGRVLVARPVVLYFADVPVAWLPFIAQGLGSGRTSGLLTPTFSVNDIVRTSGGYSRRVSNVGVYWAMSDYTDMSVAMDWWSGNYLALTGTTRYNWARRFLRGDVAYRQFWRENGSESLAFTTFHEWTIDERTSFRASGAYASSADLVRRNSFDPNELTQSINSDGGFNRRFSWGNFSTTARRQQYLSDDRVETVFPSVNLSLTPITLFSAAPAASRFYNNLTWSGSGRFERNSSTRPLEPGAAFDPSRWNRVGTSGNVSSSLSMGGLSWSQSMNFRETGYQGVPIFPDPPEVEEGEEPPELLPIGTVDQAQATMDWSSSLSYTQRLVGSMSITPTISLTGQRLRSDTIPEVSSGFVDGPVRLSFGAGLNTDLYAFFPGVGGFDAIRHKISPGFDYSYAPAVVPTELQRRVFGAGDAQARNRITFRMNQTFEARRAPREEAETEPEEAGAAMGGEPAAGTGGEETEQEVAGAEEAAAAAAAADPLQQLGAAATRTGEAPRRREQAEIVRLLGLTTTAVTYNFVLADSLGRSRGWETTTLSNTVTSDYLRGLSLSMTHELFDDSGLRDPEGSGGRRFSPYLTQLATGFSLGSSSGIFRRLGLFQGGGREGQQSREPELDEGTRGDGTAIIPGLGGRGGGPGAPRFTGAAGAWNASFTYALSRSRSGGVAGETQTLGANLSFRPTEAWDVRWQTSYDITGGGFNQHSVSLTRDLHEWEATFDFVQTITGNWSFRFNVSLVANRDLKFDYEQRSQRQTGLDDFFR
jgi:hypothetical protein